MRDKASAVDEAGPRRRRRLTGAVKQSLRELRMQLSLLNLRVGAHLALKDVDLDCLDLVASHGPLSPSTLAHRAGLHPATMTGILDRLERGEWVVRERSAVDRRGVVVRARHERVAELVRLYSGMNTAMDELCAGYTDAQLALLVEFLRRSANAGRGATDELTSAPHTT
ncbi:MAG: MarR family transcriptional regulator [Chloroflexi bacterium]|nr:MarR family transcriptional regulator [Chloroflexota bacterium]